MKNFVDTRRKEVLLFVGEMEWAELKCNGKQGKFWPPFIPKRVELSKNELGVADMIRYQRRSTKLTYVVVKICPNLR